MYRNRSTFFLLLILLTLTHTVTAQDSHRYAVVNFTSHDVDSSVVEQMRQDFEYYLIQNKVQVVERSQLKYFLQQQEFELQIEEIGLADQSKILELGKLVSPDRFVFGHIRKNAYDSNFTLEITIVNAKTAINITAKRMESPDIAGFFEGGLESLAFRLMNPSGTVRISSLFRGRLYIDDEYSAEVNPNTIVERYVKAGKHTFTMRYTGPAGSIIHSESKTSYIQTDGQVRVAFEWTPPSGTVRVQSQTSGDLYIDGEFYSKIEANSPIEFTILQGYREFEMQYSPESSSNASIPREEKSLYIRDNKNYDLNFSWETPSGTLMVHTISAGALYIDGNLRQRVAGGSNERIELPTGTYTVEMRYADKRETRQVSIAKDETASVNFSWKPFIFPTVRIVPGSFIMGSDERINQTQKRVRISKPLDLAVYETTNDQLVRVYNWALRNGEIRIVGSKVYNRSGSSKQLLEIDSENSGVLFADGEFRVKSGRGSYPAVEVTWYGAAAFCNFLSSMQGFSALYNFNNWTCDWRKTGYRLPTEAEWEYAAGGGLDGNNTLYSGSSTSELVAWYRSNSGGRLHPVGQKQPNELGLYDMSGNVSEWCWDWYQRSLAEVEEDDPRGPRSGEYRVRKGGAWSSRSRSIEVNARSYTAPEHSSRYVGFRVVRPQ